MRPIGDMEKMIRTHNCGELNEPGVDVVLDGWVDTRRDHGGVIFIDLRDRFGLTQVVFEPTHNKELHAQAEKLRREYVIRVEGKSRNRKPGMANPSLSTGEIEILADKLIIHNKSEVPPIEIDDRKPANEDMRLKYRYLDMRRPIMQKQILIRHKAAKASRDFLNNNGFLEIETPIFVKATPEGARDYIVPSRVNPGHFYALPQSPQLYKQILMISGFDRYYQIARCLRDEDLRSDRQPEFTQIDLEMSFVTQEDVFELNEGLMKAIFKESIGHDVKTPFVRFTFDESMARFGTDKPDIRFGLELTDVTEVVKGSDFSVFKTVIEKGGIVKCINPEKDISRKEIDRYIGFTQENGSKGMAWLRVTDKGLESNIAKYFSEDVQKQIIEKTGAKPGSVLMFIADKKRNTNEILSRLRQKLADDLELYDPKEFNFCWVVDYPLFEWDEDSDSWSPAHHMFTRPNDDSLEFLDSDPGKVYAQCYDLVLNGYELGSGSLREFRPDVQKKIMNIVGFPDEKAEERFGFLLHAFKYGAPPHGGIGLGFDRIVALACGYNDIREVIAFPKNKSAQCPMDGSPSPVDNEALKDLHIKLDIAKK